jgi:hypothetical protein
MADPSPSQTTQVGSAPVTDEGARESDQAEVLTAIRALSAQVGDLQAEVETLRAQARVLPPGERNAPGWEEPRRPTPALTWVETIEAPSSRAAAVPRLLLEVIFLVAVAVGAAIAELEAVEIVALMAVAWALVAIAEFAGARADRRRAQAVYGPYPLAGYPSDASWFAPAVERTMLDLTQEESPPPARLPPPSDD